MKGVGIKELNCIVLCLILWGGDCAQAEVYSVIKSFGVLTNMTGLCPRGYLVRGSDGALYGAAGPEGAMGGTVFKLQSDGSGFTVLKWFTNRLEGAEPNGGLVLEGNTLYGAAYSGGESNLGVVFMLNTDGTGFAVLKHFTGTDGANPKVGLALAGNTLYGTTYGGGGSNCGTVFRVNTDGTGFNVLKHFTGPDGKNPEAALVVSGNVLYGTTFYGGSAGYGTLFKLNTDGTGFAVLKHFGNDGRNPSGTLVLDGNTLYGTTCYGSISYGPKGTVFRINTDGTCFAVIKGFDGEEATCPQGLVLSGETLYGTAMPPRESLSRGVVFRLNTDGTGFATIWGFSGPDGLVPNAGLVVTGNTLYGTAAHGGSLGLYGSERLAYPGFGTVFKLNTDGGGFAVLKEFYMSDAQNPRGNLAVYGNTLYGATERGGARNAGTVFKLNTDGTEYAVLKQFKGELSDGQYPRGGVAFAEGALYGAADHGVDDVYSCVFKLNTNGAGFTVLCSSGWNTAYAHPLVASGAVYWAWRGECGWGVYRFNTDGTLFTTLTNFDWCDSEPQYDGRYGNDPSGGFALAHGTIYGTAYSGGEWNLGTVFKLNVDGTGFTVLKHFAGHDGAHPNPVLTLSDGMLYGTTRQGGISNCGVVFKLNIDGTGYSVLKHFTGSDGASPTRGLALVGDVVYGTTLPWRPFGSRHSVQAEHRWHRVSSG
ncbi:MAG: hypothetical protein NZ739_08875 [Verrucomicrobiae bacterium]|nr:hypothetical protein [Verrucomicrobiae bacterium]